MLSLLHKKLAALLPLSLQQLIQTLRDASHSCCTAAVPCIVASIVGRIVGTITAGNNSCSNNAAMCWSSRYTVCVADLYHSTIVLTVRTYRPCVWLHILYSVLIFLLTEAMTRLCSCGPTSAVVELLESLKMLWASISADSVSDIFCAMVDDGFNWLPSMCGALTPFWNLSTEYIMNTA